MNSSTIARQMLSLANLPATNGDELKQLTFNAVQNHEVGANSTVGIAYAAMRRAPREMTRKVIADACYASVVEGATLSIDGIAEHIGDIERTANQIVMVLASARGFSPHPVTVFSRKVTNGITGDTGTWINLNAEQTMEYLQSDEFDPHWYAAEGAMKRIDWSSVGFDELEAGDTTYGFLLGEPTEDTPWLKQIAVRTISRLQRWNVDQLTLLLTPERWEHAYPAQWLAINEVFIKEAINLYTFWKPILVQRLERTDDKMHFEADGRHWIEEGEDQRMQEGKSAHLLTPAIMHQRNLDSLEDALKTVVEMVERNVGNIPKALGRPLAAKTVYDEESGQFLYMDIDTRIAEAERERREDEAAGRVRLTEEKRTRRATAVTSINLDF